MQDQNRRSQHRLEIVVWARTWFIQCDATDIKNSNRVVPHCRKTKPRKRTGSIHMLHCLCPSLVWLVCEFITVPDWSSLEQVCQDVHKTIGGQISARNPWLALHQQVCKCAKVPKGPRSKPMTVARAKHHCAKFGALCRGCFDPDIRADVRRSDRLRLCAECRALPRFRVVTEATALDTLCVPDSLLQTVPHTDWQRTRFFRLAKLAQVAPLACAALENAQERKSKRKCDACDNDSDEEDGATQRVVGGKQAWIRFCASQHLHVARRGVAATIAKCTEQLLARDSDNLHRFPCELQCHGTEFGSAVVSRARDEWLTRYVTAFLDVKHPGTDDWWRDGVTRLPAEDALTIMRELTDKIANRASASLAACDSKVRLAFLESCTESQRYTNWLHFWPESWQTVIKRYACAFGAFGSQHHLDALVCTAHRQAQSEEQLRLRREEAQRDADTHACVRCLVHLRAQSCPHKLCGSCCAGCPRHVATKRD